MSAANLTDINTLIAAMEQGLKPVMERNPLMIGIHTGGVWIAERLHQQLALPETLGTIDISFYRDDFTRIGLNPEVKASDLPVDPNDRYIILVDDVLHTGRTTRAAMNVIFDYGRPQAIVLAVLVERDGRELPIQPDVVGQHLQLEPQQQVKLAGPESLSLQITEKTP